MLRKFAMVLICSVVCLLGMGNNFCGAEFSVGGFFPEAREGAVVLRCAEEMNGFIEEIIEEAKSRGDDAMQPFYAAFEREVRSFFTPYDEEFFECNNLITAVLARGSGSLRFSLAGLLREGGTLKIRVRCTSPTIQTMDYRTHVMRLAVSKALYDAPKAEVTVEKVIV